MGKFRKGGKGNGCHFDGIASDIVFMLLFFFMVATVLRTEEEKVTVIRPEATELYKIEKKHLIRYINIGKPLDKRYGTTEIVQLNDAIQGLKPFRTGWTASV